MRFMFPYEKDTSSNANSVRRMADMCEYRNYTFHSVCACA